MERTKCPGDLKAIKNSLDATQNIKQNIAQNSKLV
jgi:hypothetical protein